MKRSSPKRKTYLKKVPMKRAVGPKTARSAAKSAKKGKSLSKLLRDADGWFSKYVRISRADLEGNVTCYTCGYTAHYKKMQNGHYISRYYKKYRFDERNCRVQCSMCNMWKNGDIPTFRAKLVAELGAAEIESMEADYKELYRLTPEFLCEIIAKYKALLDTPELSPPHT